MIGAPLLQRTFHMLGSDVTQAGSIQSLSGAPPQSPDDRASPLVEARRMFGELVQEGAVTSANLIDYVRAAFGRPPKDALNPEFAVIGKRLAGCEHDEAPPITLARECVWIAMDMFVAGVGADAAFTDGRFDTQRFVKEFLPVHLDTADHTQLSQHYVAQYCEDALYARDPSGCNEQTITVRSGGNGNESFTIPRLQEQGLAEVGLQEHGLAQVPSWVLLSFIGKELTHSDKGRLSQVASTFNKTLESDLAENKKIFLRARNVVRRLMYVNETNIDFNKRDNWGRTALHRVILGHYGWFEDFRALLDCEEIDVNAPLIHANLAFDQGFTPLHFAAKKRVGDDLCHLQALLVHPRVRHDVRSWNGNETALHVATRERELPNTQGLALLLQFKDKIGLDAQDVRGYTALHNVVNRFRWLDDKSIHYPQHTVVNRSIYIDGQTWPAQWFWNTLAKDLSLLVEAGADTSVQNKDGHTAYEMASRLERVPLLAILPKPGSWQEKLRVCVDETDPKKVKAGFDRAMLAAAPENGGSIEAQQAIQAAWDAARRDINVKWAH